MAKLRAQLQLWLECSCELRKKRSEELHRAAVAAMRSEEAGMEPRLVALLDAAPSSATHLVVGYKVRTQQVAPSILGLTLGRDELCPRAQRCCEALRLRIETERVSFSICRSCALGRSGLRPPQSCSRSEAAALWPRLRARSQHCRLTKETSRCLADSLRIQTGDRDVSRTCKPSQSRASRELVESLPLVTSEMLKRPVNDSAPCVEVGFEAV